MLVEISTYKTFLMTKETNTWKKVIDIKEFPDLGGTPEMIEITTLSDKVQRNIPGVQSLDALEFTANYTLTEYKALKALEGTEKEFAVWFGGIENGDTVTPNGSDGKFKFKGQLSVYTNGGGTNEVVEMTISIAASSAIVIDTDA
nr:MAG TPA: Major tail protein [Caudoviricetes sp.]